MSAGTALDLGVRLAELPGPGAPLVRTAEVPVSEHAIRTWCAAVGEASLVHHDRDAARRAGYVDVVAPNAMLQTWAMPIGERGRAAAPTLHARVRAAAREAGLGAVVATDYEQEYLRPVHPGELLSERSWIDGVSAPKTTALGPGRFVTIGFEIVDEGGEPVGSMRARTLYFDPAPVATTARAAAAEDADELEPLEVPLTRTLIITASLASNDHEPVHHDHEVARAQGLDDIIASIVTTTGLVLRYAGERTSPRTRCRRLRLRLARPAFPGDVLVLTGTVAPSGDGATLAVRGDHARGRHVTAEVVLTAASS